MNKLVSIIMPNFNGQKFLSKAIESVISQSYSNWELIVFDDCSKDNSFEIIKGYSTKDSRVKAHQNIKNSGTSVTRNNALRSAKGEYIAFLDSDDWWHRDFLSNQVSTLETKGADLVFCNYEMVDEEGKYIKTISKFREELTYQDNLKENHIAQLTGLFKRSSAPEVFYDEGLGSIKDDYAFWLDVLKKSSLAVGNNKVLASYRVFSGSITSSKTKLIKPHFKLLYQRQKIGLLKSFIYTLNWGITGIYNFYLKS